MRRRGPGVVRTMGRTAAIVGTATVTSAAVGGAMQGRAAKKQAAAQQQAAAQEEQAAAQEEQAPEQMSQDEIVAKLKQLKELNDAGVLTDEEYEPQRQELLAQLGIA